MDMHNGTLTRKCNKFKAFRGILCLALVALTTTVSAAEMKAKFRYDSMPAVANGPEFVTEQNKTFKYNESLAFTVNTVKNTEGKNLQIRIFPLIEGEKYPRPWGAYKPCNVYYSVAIPFKYEPGSAKIDLGVIGNEWWLGPSLEAGSFLVVFELLSDEIQQANSQNLSYNQNILRLDTAKKAHENYFNNGIVIHVQPPEVESKPKQIDMHKELTFLKQKAVLDEIRINDASRKCFKYKTIKVAGNEEKNSGTYESAVLAHCTYTD
jgi:hypothetical protein